jgi:hypothetical protein
MLTAAQAAKALGITARDLSDLIAAGWLRPIGPDARCYPASQVKALLNGRGGVPRDLRPGVLRGLGQALATITGHGLECQLRRDGQHPHLLIQMPASPAVPVWLVATSTGWRFLWHRYRSHTAADLSGAAAAIAASLSLPTQSPRCAAPQRRPAQRTPASPPPALARPSASPGRLRGRRMQPC